MWEKIELEEEQPKMSDPALVIALSTPMPQYRVLYSQGRELGKFMLKKMGFRRFATVYSSALPPAVIISEDGTARLTCDSFYHLSGRRDVILLAGDASPVEDQYGFSRSILTFARRLGVKELFSVGARWTEAVQPASVDPAVLGFSTHSEGVERLKAHGATIVRDEPAPYFASLVVGLSERSGIRGYKLEVNHGEPIPHPRSLARILETLGGMLEFEVDTSELREKAKAMVEESLQESMNAQPENRRERQGVYG